MESVQWKTPDDGQRNCPKYVEFLDRNKFGKLVRLSVLLKQICYDARSHERKIQLSMFIPKLSVLRKSANEECEFRREG